MNLNRQITNRLFDDFSLYEALLPWVDFLKLLPDYLACFEEQLVTQTIGSSKIVNSIIGSNVYIGDYTLIRNAVIESDVRIGAHVQVNMSVLRRGVELPHFNNVGYSFLGEDVLFGSGASTASRRLDGKYPSVVLPEGSILTSSTAKYGALIGNGCRIGSQVVINPFTIIERGSVIYPLRSVSGYLIGG